MSLNADALGLNGVCDHPGQEVGHGCANVDIRGLNQQSDQRSVIGDDIFEPLGIDFEDSIEHAEQVLEGGRLQPESEGELVADWQNYLIKVVWLRNQHRKEFDERCRRQTLLEKVGLVVLIYLLLQCPW